MRHTPLSLTTLATLCAALLSGCSSQPDRAEIMVITTPPGASCTLSRLGQPIATAEPTPAIALVEPSESEVTILCRRHGFEDAVGTLMARKTDSGFNLLSSRSPFDDQHRIDLALRAKPPSSAPR